MTGLIEIGKDTFPPALASHQAVANDRDLELLLADVARAIDRKDIGNALRFADRARRIASGNSSCNLLYGRLLIESGLAAQALPLLESENDPDTSLVRGLALFELGRVAEASKCCADLLQGFSVSSIDGLRRFASRLCRSQGSVSANGWVGVDDNLNIVGESRRGSHVEIECVDGSHPVARYIDTQEDFVSFSCSLSAEFFGPVRIRASGKELLGSGLAWPPDFKTSVWVSIEGELLLGDAQLRWSPKLHVALELSSPDTASPRIIVTTPVVDSNSPTFSAPLLPDELVTSQLDVVVVLPSGKRVSPVGSPLYPGRRSANPVAGWARRFEPSAPLLISPPLAEGLGVIDIIIPVYTGLRETLDCLHKVLGTTNRRRAEIVVVNDASPDPQLCNALVSLAGEKQITLIVNASNLGFAGAVNRGIRLHPDRDIILLNADTQVFGDWIDRLTRAAVSSPDVGTATPLGENGSITDYSCGKGSAGTSAEEIDRSASKANLGKVIDIPVGVGFCMYIKRTCLDHTGEFDVMTFGKGYGEENDFCLRARSSGWCHVAATDVFIAHHGGRSFGETSKSYRKRNSRVLNTLYPGYADLIKDFSAADPLLEARRAIDMVRLSALASSPVLLVTHDLSGGVKRHIDHRETELRAAGHTVLTLQRSASHGPSTRIALTENSLNLSSLLFDLPKDLQLIERLLQDLRLSHVEIHHFIGVTPTVLQMATELNVPYDIYIHDYAWICPRVTLIDGTGKYCAEPPLAVCEQCIRMNGSAMDEPITVSELRGRSANLLERARRVILPSTDARQRLAKYFPSREFETISWESVANSTTKFPVTTSVGRVRVAVIGAIGIPKGYSVLLDCARDAAARDLNLEFVVIGHTADDRSLLDTGRVFITGPYEEDEVGTLLDREDCTVAFFPSVTPETWCYSLTHAMKHSLPIIAFDLGAQAERLQAYPAAELLPLSLNTQQVNFALVRRSGTLTTPLGQPEQEPPLLEITKQNAGDGLIQELVSSIQVLKLPEGMYAFTVKDGGSQRDGSEALALPGLQVALAPAHSPGKVEFLTGTSVVERWLAYGTDLVVVRITGGDGSLLLTSLQKQDSPSLAVNLERLNVHIASFAAGGDVVQESGQRKSLNVRLMAHIRYVGDLDFAAGPAGWTGQKLWIEGFAVLAVGDLPANSVEYRGLIANGLQTPWLSSPSFCGSRGAGLPLLGFAVRIKPTWAERYTCTYDGRFFSGAKVGSLQNGALCSSDLPGDPLEAMELRVTERQIQATATSGGESMTAYG